MEPVPFPDSVKKKPRRLAPIQWELTLLTMSSKRCKAVEKRFFDTTGEFGGDLLKQLVKKEPAKCAGAAFQEVDCAFCNIVSGEEDLCKHAILDWCPVLCGQKWQCQSRARKGEMLDSASFVTSMHMLFSAFEGEDTKCRWQEDFNRAGQFHGTMEETWKECQKKGPTLGTGKSAALFDEDLGVKVRDAMVDG